MTQEEKAKRYDDALKVANKYKDTHIMFPSIKEEMFPELKESEDERTWIINYLSNKILNSTIIAEKENLKKAIAWLENQCEQKPADKVEPKFKEGDTIRLKDGDGRLWKIEKIREDGYTMIGHGLDETDFLFLDDKWEVVEPYQESNPTAHAPVRDNYDEIKQAETSSTLSNSSNIRKNAWSEEDEERLQSCLNILQAKGIMGVTKTVNSKWLKSLKDRVQLQPNPALGEEDRRMLTGLIDELDAIMNKATPNEISVYSKYANWLKSLRPQNRWKPSDEQMEAVKCAALDVSKFSSRSEQLRLENEPYYKALVSLYNDLKKLKQ